MGTISIVLLSSLVIATCILAAASSVSAYRLPGGAGNGEFSIISGRCSVADAELEEEVEEAIIAREHRLIDRFESWLTEHSKAYASFEEKLRRFEIFKDNVKHIEESNEKRAAKAASYWLGVNEFADLAHDEFKRMYLGVSSPETTRRRRRRRRQDDDAVVDDLPKWVDWRRKGAVGPVKNQGQCGSCWAFSTVAAVEGINQIVTGNMTTLSEQELIDCDNSFNNGCSGGLMDYAFRYIASSGGLHTERDYPYLMEEGTCDHKKTPEMEVVTITGYEDVPQNDEESFLKALARQPLSVAIDASGRNFQFYAGGVFDGECGTQVDHGVAAVGYGSIKGQDFIIVKNSWGAKWGEKGYVRMKRSGSDGGSGEGPCGMYKMASFPTKN